MALEGPLSQQRSILKRTALEYASVSVKLTHLRASLAELELLPIADAQNSLKKRLLETAVPLLEHTSERLLNEFHEAEQRISRIQNPPVIPSFTAHNRMNSDLLSGNSHNPSAHLSVPITNTGITAASDESLLELAGMFKPSSPSSGV